MNRRHPAHRFSWCAELAQILRHRRDENPPTPAPAPEPTPEPIEHTGADLNWSPAAELAAIGAGVLDHNPDPITMGSEADEKYWHDRFAEIQTGHQAAVDELFAGVVAAAGWDEDEFRRGYVEIVSTRAWIDHDVEDSQGIPVPIATAAESEPRLTVPQARRARKRAHKELVNA